jgi:hypothetical protein
MNPPPQQQQRQECQREAPASVQRLAQPAVLPLQLLADALQQQTQHQLLQGGLGRHLAALRQVALGLLLQTAANLQHQQART